MKSLSPDDDWELTRAFCNLVLRWGMEHEAKQMAVLQKREREYREKVVSKLKVVDKVRKDLRRENG